MTDTPITPACGVEYKPWLRRDHNDPILQCELPRGHDGPHRVAMGDEWPAGQAGGTPAPTEPAGCPTCTGTTRETTGLVCQTCGTDYGPPAEALDVDAIADGATGWDRDWIGDLPGCLAADAWLKPDLAGRARRELAALLSDVDRLTAEVRRLRGETDRLAAWLDQHVPTRWHRGGTPVDVTIAMLASWSDRGVLATALREVQAERDEARARVAELETGMRWAEHRAGRLADVATRQRRTLGELEAEAERLQAEGDQLRGELEQPPTMWQVPPEPGPEVTQVWSSTRRWDRDEHGWTPEDDWRHRQWPAPPAEDGPVSATPPAGTEAVQCGRVQALPAGTEVCAHLCAGPYGEDMCDRQKATQAPCRGCPEAPPHWTEAQ